MKTLLLLLIGFWVAVPIMAQRMVVDLKYTMGSIIRSLDFYSDSIVNCELRRVFIKGKTNFAGTIFSNEANFTYATFSNRANFTEAAFSSNAYFTEATFTGEASFLGTTFSALPYFYKTTFLNYANFEGTTFSGGAQFSGTTFSGGANFAGATFSNEANFAETTFTKEANFSRTAFSNEANFSSATFLALPYFTDTELPDSLFFESINLQNVNTNIFLTLTQADTLRKYSGDTKRKCTIFLWHTDVSKLVIDFEKFRLGFNKSVVLDERIGTYQQVIKKCRDMGMEASAQGFDIDLQIMKLQDRWGPVASPFIWFQEYWWNFGYDRDKVFRNTIIAFIISFVLILLGFNRFRSTYFPAEQLGLTATDTDSKSYRDKLKITFFYTALIFFGWMMDYSKLNYRDYPWTALVIYLIYVIGLIHLAYLAGFVIAR